MFTQIKITTKSNSKNSLVKISTDKKAKDFDYVKNGDQFIFTVKTKNEEELRKVGHKIRTLLPKTTKSIDLEGAKAEFIAEGLLLSNYQFLKYFKDKKEKTYALKSINWVKGDEKTANYLNNTAMAVCWARDLVNEPLSYLTAPKLAQEIQEKGKEAGFKVEVFEKAKIEALKMGGLLAVNKGSIDPPTFTILEHKPKNPINKKPIVLVGKGVVYDTGGLSLKPTAHSMDIMKSDMGGAACMAATIYAMALNNSNVHVIGLIPATDNRPGGNAYAPGDVVKMYDGTTVEVLNTDAEGRMILADALAYANKYEPELVIDAATLTGAAVRAVGTKATCIMGNAKEKYFIALDKAGNQTQERLVRFPFWDDYAEEVKSKIADLKNLGGPYAGQITAGKFLEHFVKYPYIHLDIAGPAFLEAPQDYKGQGGTGVGVRLLSQFFNNMEK
ncbi:MAG: leucyl aminopeptidase family protein [Lishizhenia sp.]